MKALEKRLQRKMTTSFIATDPTITDGQLVGLVLYRPPTPNARTDSMGGRVHGAAVAQPAQQAKLVPARSRSSSLTYTKPTGEIVSSKDALLVGRWDLNVQVHDFFTWQGRTFTVTFIEPDRTYITLCQLDELGVGERVTE